ncbi:MAG: DUF4333 domain-containing protein [Acidimicrobiales bacterium]
MGGLPRALLGLAVLLQACSASVSVTRKLNTDNAERTIRESYGDLYGTPLDAVDCPEREAKTGDVFDCTARIEGQNLSIRVTQRDEKGNVDFVPNQAVLDLEKAAEVMAQSISEQTGTPAGVDCGEQRVAVKDVGASFDCQATPLAGGASRRVVVTVENVEGKVDFRLA